MTTTRGTILILDELVRWQSTGGFTLPADVLAAVELHTAARALLVPELPPVRHAEDVAAAALDTLGRGETPDVAALVADLHDAQLRVTQAQTAQQMVTFAIEQAGERTASVISGACDRIIVEALQPAYAETLQAAAAVAPALAGSNLADGGWDAPPKVREARRKLTDLAERHRALRSARARCVQLSNQPQPEYDDAGLFVVYREPLALVPGGYTPGTRATVPPLPTDATERLLYLVTKGLPGQPWLPTVAEQDAAWLASPLGEHLQKQRAAGEHARALAGQP